MPVATFGRKYEKFAAFSFKGGLDVKTSPQVLASNPRYQDRLTLARAVTYLTSGGVSKRLDTATYNTTTLGASVAVTGGFQFRHSNGTDYNLCGTDDGRVVRLNSDGTTTNLVTGLTVGARWYFAQYADLAIISNRVDTPRSYDGTTFGVLAGSPPATGGPWAVHGNRVLCWDATQLSRLSFCALNNPTDWTTASDAGSIQIMRNDGGTGVFLLPGMAGECLLGKTNGIYRLQGNAPATGYTVTQVVPTRVSIGGASFQGAAFGANDGYWISQRGIHSVRTSQNFGDYREKFLSEKIDQYFLPNTSYTITLTQLVNAVLAYDPQHNWLFAGVDTTGDGDHDTLFALDLFDGGWAVWPSISCDSLWTAYNGVNGYETWMGGHDGFVRRLNVSASTNAIAARFNHISDLGVPLTVKAPRQLYVYLSEEGNQNLTVTTNYDFGASGGQSYPVSQLGASHTLGVNWVLGTDPLGARAQIIKRLSVSGQGEFLELGFANANVGEPFTVYGYEVLFRRRRTIGRGA